MLKKFNGRENQSHLKVKKRNWCKWCCSPNRQVDIMIHRVLFNCVILVMRTGKGKHRTWNPAVFQDNTELKRITDEWGITATIQAAITDKFKFSGKRFHRESSWHPAEMHWYCSFVLPAAQEQQRGSEKSRNNWSSQNANWYNQKTGGTAHSKCWRDYLSRRKPCLLGEKWRRVVHDQSLHWRPNNRSNKRDVEALQLFFF